MSLLVTFAGLIIISVLIKLIFENRNRRINEQLKQFPSHPTYPLIGNIHLILNPKESLLEKGEKVLRPYDRQVFKFGPIKVILLKKYDDIATIVSQCQDRDWMGLHREWLGIGILTARYTEWKRSRRVLTQAFTSEMLSKYLQVFNKNASILVENLNSVADTGEELDVLHGIIKASLDSITENVMSISIQTEEKRKQEFGDAILDYAEHISTHTKSLVISKIHIQVVFTNYKETKIIEHLNYFPTQILRKKLNELQDCQHQNANSSRTVIDLLIKQNLTEQNFTEMRIKDELVQLMGAGVETTGMSVSFLLLMLTINQDVQQKAYEEIAQLSTSGNGELTENDLTNLKYLEQCIKETLRMFSPVTVDMRRTHKEILLGDKIVPANVVIIPIIYFANKDSELFENPLKWDPEHFSAEAVKKRPKTGELIFGYGPRNCIGAKYAMMNIKTLVASILRRYHLSTNIKELTQKDLSIDLSIRSKLGYPVKFASRSKASI